MTGSTNSHPSPQVILRLGIDATDPMFTFTSRWRRCVADDEVDALARVGVRAIPGAGIVQDIWGIVRPKNANERFNQAAKEYEDDLAVRMVDRIREIEGQLQRVGTPIDPPTPHRTLAVAREVATSAANAQGEPKVDAVLNAGARQFDPRMGPQEARRYWLNKVMALGDLEVRVLQLLKHRQPVFYFVATGELHWGSPPELADLPDEDRIALGSVLLEMQRQNDLVHTSGATANIDNHSARGAILTPRGEVLVRFIQPIAI
jgi:hypothetical protein